MSQNTDSERERFILPHAEVLQALLNTSVQNSVKHRKRTYNMKSTLFFLFCISLVLFFFC